MGFHVYIIYITLLSISEDKSKINKPPIFHPIKTYGVMNGPPGPPKKKHGSSSSHPEGHHVFIQKSL